MANLERLLELAEELLSAQAATPIQKIQAISDYCESFAAWRSEYNTLEKGSLPPETARKLERLAEHNAAIIELAESVQAETGRDLNELNKKARGLRAYGGILPGSSSRILRGKKG